MMRTVRVIGTSMIATFLVLSAGCSTDRAFVYKPNPPAAGGQRIPSGVAVLPFQDGTENFTLRGSPVSDGHYNLAKTGVGGGMTSLPPELWGKSFADDLAASGSFRSVRFVYSSADAARDESFLLDGTLKKALYGATAYCTNEILVSFRATRMSDGKVVWEKEAGVEWKERPQMSPTCTLRPSCLTGKNQEDWNRRMAGVFAEARKDFLVAIASLTEGGAGDNAGAMGGGKAAGTAEESVDQVIDKILKGK